MNLIKLITTLLITVFSAITVNSQSREMVGKWVLDRTQFSNGKNLEINNPNYSSRIVYIIEPNSLKINGQKLKASFTDAQIITDFRRINYFLKDKYLIVQDENDDKISFLMKAKDFVEKYPEFSLNKVIREKDTVYLANDLSDYIFQNDLSFENFINKNRIQRDRSSKSFRNIHFKVEFILTKKNRIKNIKVLNSIDPGYDADYINALMKSEKFLKNLTDKDLLITKENNHLKWRNDVTDNDEKLLYSLRRKGLESYDQNKFEQAISNFVKIKALDLKNDRFKTLVKESMIKLGVSYLAVGKIKSACDVFGGIGDTSDFEVRNYLIDFCSKPITNDSVTKK